MTLRYLSLFSGIEAASQAWHPLGWQCVGFSEIEGFPCDVLKDRWPGVPNLGDITRITEADIIMLGPIDLIVFGSPCQDLSVAGKRKGLDGARSGLFFAAMHIIGWAREWCGLRGALWENVPGAFTSNEGRDFAAVVDALVGLEIGTTVVPEKKKWGNEGAAIGPNGLVEWATLDAQWCGVAQRRRRLFAVADFGDWAGRPPILLEPESLRGDSAPRRGTEKDVAGTLEARTAGGGFPGTDGAVNGHVVVSSLDASYARLQGCSGQDLNHGHSHLVAERRSVLTSFGGNNTAGPIDVATTLNAHGSASGRLDFESETFVVHAADVHATLDSNNGPRRHNGVLSGMSVRRLTPHECERLQGMADDYTLIKRGQKLAADGPRYKALGNSMAVPVMAWIGQRIDFAWRWF